MNILVHSKKFLVFSALILIPGLISLGVWGLNLSIDFTGGANLEFSFKEDIADADLKVQDILKRNEVEVLSSKYNSKTAFYKTSPISANKFQSIKENIEKEVGVFELKNFESIGPSVGSETAKKSFIAVGIASLCILLYIAFAFRNIPKPYSSFRFGACAILAMLHDAFIVLGVFSLLGKLYNIQVDALFITALLTIIGFSVHDTIVVFDRIRENLKKFPNNTTFETVVNFSVLETLNRSLATSLTVIFTLTSLLILGGESIRYFSLALLIGIISGTYSSIFTAAPLLVLWESKSLKK